MRRFSFVASAILVIFGSSSFLLAQHSAGGHASVGHVSGGAHAPTASGYTGIARSAFSSPAPTGARPPAYSGYTGIAPGAIPRGGRNYAARGFVPFIGYPYYVSTFDDSASSYNNNYVQDPAAQTAEVTGNLLGEQMNRLSAEVDELRAEQAAPRTQYAAPAADPVDPPANDPPVVLVMQNGTRLTMQSYAVSAGSFWDFSTQPARKIPFSSINLAASEKATEANGAEFPVLR